jgi:transcriptional regulator
MSLHQTLLERLRAVPGVEAASSADVAPFGFNDALDASTHRTAVSAEIGAEGEVGGHAFQSALTVDDWQVDAGYFHAMGIPLLAGPGFTGHEQQDQARAYPRQLQLTVVIDEALARRLFPGQDAIGKLIGPWPPGMRVVGVAGEVKQSDLAAPSQVAGAVYFATAGTQARQTILLRTRQSASSVAALLRGTLADLDPELAVHDVQPLAALVSRSVGARQVASWLLTGFAALSLVLCLVGVFGVLNYTFSQRAKELGIRLALGAQPGEVATMVLRSAAALAIVGLAVGMCAFLTLQRWIGAITYGVDPRGWWLIAGAMLSLAVMSLGASLPAALSRCTGRPARGIARGLNRCQSLAALRALLGRVAPPSSSVSWSANRPLERRRVARFLDRGSPRPATRSHHLQLPPRLHAPSFGLTRLTRRQGSCHRYLYSPSEENDLLHGTLDVLVLRTVAAGPMHGYAITKSIEERTNQELDILDSALYKALQRLEASGAIDTAWGVSDNNRRAKYYSLTARGRRQLRVETATWKRFVTAVTGVLEPDKG